MPTQLHICLLAQTSTVNESSLVEFYTCIWGMISVDILVIRGGDRHFHLGGPLEGPVLQQGELSMVCVGLQCSGMTSRGKFWGGQAKLWGGSGPLWHPPSSAPARYQHCRNMLSASVKLLYSSEKVKLLYLLLRQPIVRVPFSKFVKTSAN